MGLAGQGSWNTGRDNYGHHPGWAGQGRTPRWSRGPARQSHVRTTASTSKKVMPTEALMEEILEPGNWESAWRAVVANQGAPGIDGMKCEELVGHLRQHGESLRAKLLAGTYVPSPVRRKSLPSPEEESGTLGSERYRIDSSCK